MDASKETQGNHSRFPVNYFTIKWSVIHRNQSEIAVFGILQHKALKEAFHVRLSQNHMATTFDLVISCEKGRTMAAEEVLKRAHQLITSLESELSEFIDTPVSQLNRSAPHQKIEATTSVMELLEKSLDLKDLTHGAFSPLAKSQDITGTISADPEEGWISRSSEGTHLGFGAIGKGYAIDRVSRLIEQEGFQDYLLNAGGSSILLSGFSSPNTPWSWGWSWKTNDGEPLGIPLMHPSGVPVAIGVSGTHEKGEHLLDPRTKEKARGLKSALVATRSATEADALSTALFVSGWEKSMEPFLDLIDKPALAAIDETEIARWNGTFQKLWGVLGLAVFFLFTYCPRVWADEAVDLFGGEEFTPYLFERNRLWILLPAITLFAVLVHLKNSRPGRKLSGGEK